MISIIIPNLNSGSFLKESISSIIKQESVKRELIIVDGGSDDGSVKIIKESINSIDQFISEPDSGQANAINKGISLAKGNIINWLNADDYYAPEALETICSHFNENINAVSARSRIFNDNGTKYLSKGTDIYPDNLAKTLGWARIDQPETFFKKDIWTVVGPLNEDLHYVFDREWWIRYLFKFGLKGFKTISDVVVHFRHHDDSKTVSNKKNFIEESRQIYASYAKHLGEFEIENAILGSEGIGETITLQIPADISKELIQSMIHYYLLMVGNEYYSQNQKQKAKLVLDLVNEKFLDKPDSRLLRKLKFRNSLPAQIIETARKINL